MKCIFLYALIAGSMFGWFTYIAIRSSRFKKAKRIWDKGIPIYDTRRHEVQFIHNEDLFPKKDKEVKNASD